MRKVLLNVAVTLDGFIEGPGGEFDWCFTDQDYGMHEFMDRVDAIFFGRKSYELLQSWDPNAYPGKAKYVFSNTLPVSPDGTQLVSGEIEKEVQRIKNEPGRDIWLFGGAKLTTGLVNAGLVDELHLSIHPLLLSGGTPLFQGLNRRVAWELVDSRTYDTGLVQLIYRYR
jgi:dihydrofolate reductase